MKKSRTPVIALLSVIAALSSQTAISGEIGFRITNNSNVGWCGGINGPWGRFGPFDQIAPGATNVFVYGAVVNLFSPFGKWLLEGWELNADEGNLCDPGSTRGVELDFCVNKTDSILITFGPDGNPTVNTSLPPCDTSVQAVAFLGEAAGQRPRGRAGNAERDVFQFAGSLGDEVIVTLEPEGTMGSTGENARLILRDQNGGALQETAEGRLPLEVNAILPESGSYQVVVAERPQAPNPFRDTIN